MNLKKFFKNKKVLITGHTGFKGSWLCLWLHKFEANICGVSNGILTKPSHYQSLKLSKIIKERIFDLSDLKKTEKLILTFQPDYIFHLAAQALVKKSYSDPILTWKSNTFGTVNILHSVSKLKKKCSVVIVTSDKSYKNFELKRGYKENDILGGYDPYSASKAGAEIAIQSYFQSFLRHKKNIYLGVARAGNVIGGGDWSQDRIIPDIMTSYFKNKKTLIRNPNSTRPWQHVLEALHGYLLLSIRTKNSKINGEAFNFGPNLKNNYSVISILKEIKKHFLNFEWTIQKKNKKKQFESSLLKLNSNKAKKILNWKNVLSFKDTIKFTSDWYKGFFDKKNIFKLSLFQIQEYERKLNK